MRRGTKNKGRAEGQRDVVRYWRLVELFSPQQVDKLDPKSDQRPVVNWRPGRPLQWDALPPAGRRGNQPQVWQHTVYLGVYRLEHIYEHLHKVFPRDEDAYDERPNGRSACAGLVVGDDGRLIAESPVLSSALWAIGRTRDPGVHNPSWIDGFDGALEDFSEHVTEYLADLKRDRRIDEDPRVDEDVLRSFLQIAQTTAGVLNLDALASADIYIASSRVRKDRAAELPGYDFLNSFFLEDLGLVAASNFGNGLNEYLTPDSELPVAGRIDVRNHPEVVIDRTNCDRLPPGRWLSNPAHPLATSQQFAVDEALHTLGRSSGLMGVNGPPGTGKTTMLRDLLAGNVVRRAEALATLADPNEAFIGTEHHWKAGDYPRRVKQLRPDLTGFEMIVASSNNAAVANVSDELPQLQQIHESWHPRADHFADLATAIATRSFQGEGEVPPSWGLIAARLGNSRNRNLFNSVFWFGAGAQSEPHDPEAGVVHGMQQMLKNWEDGTDSRPSWRKARITFEAAHRHVDALVDDARAADRRLGRCNGIGEELQCEEQRMRDLDERMGTAERDLAEVRLRADHLHGITISCSAHRTRHLDARPGWLEGLMTWGKAAREWRQELILLNDALAANEQQIHQVHVQMTSLHQYVSSLREEKGWIARKLADLREESRVLAIAVAADAEHYGPCYPGASWLTDESQRELHGAWQGPDLNRARADLFLAALQLHHAFLANATGIRQGLMGSLDVMLGVAPVGLDASARLAAWQLFFIAVPLISTTFASVGRMLNGVGGDSLGWLLIDEAGQATPQAAVGAIWRAKRVLAVGDPMQLKPVVTIPRRAQHDLAKRFGISDTWVPSYTSVQQLSDRIGRYGTTLTNGTERTWVSAPLRVHRRCDSPMFGVSNMIAYENMMINGVHRSAEAIAKFNQISSSRWIDVSDPDPGSHLQMAEIEQLRREIDELLKTEVKAEDIIAISPFRAVAQELKRVAEDYPGMTGGTIHTAQGREAPVVFLVLGGDPQSNGAKRWASSMPNLVNVAASRAQRRLYVIGDRNGWHKYPNFDVLAAQLPCGERSSTEFS